MHNRMGLRVGLRGVVMLFIGSKIKVYLFIYVVTKAGHLGSV